MSCSLAPLLPLPRSTSTSIQWRFSKFWKYPKRRSAPNPRDGCRKMTWLKNISYISESSENFRLFYKSFGSFFCSSQPFPVFFRHLSSASDQTKFMEVPNRLRVDFAFFAGMLMTSWVTSNLYGTNQGFSHLAFFQDFYAGGISENPVNRGDGVVGPSFSCIIAGQFRDWRVGDRFWYENPGQFRIGMN